jgi:hypothetical protein
VRFEVGGVLAVAAKITEGREDRYPFRQPGEVRLTLKIAPEKINETGLEE